MKAEITVQEAAFKLLLDPGDEYQTRTDVRKLISYLNRNKISLIKLDRKPPGKVVEAFRESELFQKALAGELNRLKSWKQDFGEIRKEFKKAGIEYILFKSDGSFPHLSDNLDVLVRNRDFTQAGTILERSGYVKLRNIQEAHKEFYRKFSGGRTVTPIHLHEEVCWGVPYLDNNHLWQECRRSTRDDLVCYPAPEDQLLIILAHCFIEDHQIKLNDLMLVTELLAENELNWDYIKQAAAVKYWQVSFFAAVVVFEHLSRELSDRELFPGSIFAEAYKETRKKHWIRSGLENDILKRKPILPFDLPHLWIRRHSTLRILRDRNLGTRLERYRIAFSKLLDGLIHNKLKIRNHPAFFLAVSGPDGCGKTSRIETLRNALMACDIRSKVVWSRPGSFPLSCLIQNLIRRLSGNRNTQDHNNNEPRRKVKRSALAISLWRWLNIKEAIVFYFFRISLSLLAGKFVIADRYIPDALVDMESISGTSNWQRIAYRFFRWCVPEPDQMIMLKTNADVLAERNREDLPGKLAQKIKYYQKVSGMFETETVDNSSDPQSADEIISRMVLVSFFSRYPDKYRGYKVVSYRYK